MALYQIIYDWFATYVWASPDLADLSWQIGGQDVTLDVWLSHTSTIVVLIALCLFLFLAVKWIFSLFADLILRVGK